MKVRLPHVLEWLAANKPDVLVLQEIKQQTEAFPAEELAAAGYQSIANGQKTYNGVAIISRSDATDAVLELPNFDDPQRRVLAATIDGVRVVNKWRETLPGSAPPGSRYHYDGISEFLYGGNGQWSFMYGLPDQVGLLRSYAQWRKDGQAEIHGEVYPGL